MKLLVEKADLEAIAEDLLHNSMMLEFTDTDNAEDDLAFYLPRIRDNAEQLKRLADESAPAATEGGPG